MYTESLKKFGKKSFFKKFGPTLPLSDLTKLNYFGSNESTCHV